MTIGIMDESEAIKVPTPDQMPVRLDLSQLPSHVLRSGAVEALANQNEDLMARLGVALRRSATLENRISELEEEIGRYEIIISSREDESLVLIEKDRLLTDRAQALEISAKEKQEQIDLLELQFAELYSTSRERIRGLEDKSDSTVRHLGILFRYRRRMKRITQSFRTRIATLTAHWKKEEEISRELKQRLGEAGLRIQNQAKDAEFNQRQLVENYEASLKEIRSRAAQLERENSAYAEKTRAYDELYEAKVHLENRLVSEQRQFAEFRQSRDAEITQLQVDLSTLRGEHKSQILSLQQLSNEKQELESALENTRRELEKSRDQVETLQLLWKDTNDKVEKLTGKNEALQKLNQQLSSTIQNQRHEIQKLRSDLETQNYATAERIKEIKGQLQMMNTGSELNFIEDQHAGNPDSPTRILSKIDTLMAEIQSGFKRQTPERSGDSSSAMESLGSGETSSP